MQRRYRTIGFCVLTVAAPIVFFSVVPAIGDSALFFDRYMIPAIPAFLVLVLAGILALARFAGPLKLVVIAVLVGWLLVHELHYDLRHRDHTRAIGIESVAHAAARQPAGSVLFGSTGTSGALFSSFDYGHPANLLDRYVALRTPSLQLVDDDSCERALPFLRGDQTPRYGVWLFYAVAPDEQRAAAAAFARTRALVVRPGPTYFLLRSPKRLAPGGADSARPRLPARLAGSGSLKPEGERALDRRPAAPAGPLCPVRRSRRSGHLAPLAAGEDDPSVGKR